MHVRGNQKLLLGLLDVRCLLDIQVECQLIINNNKVSYRRLVKAGKLTFYWNSYTNSREEVPSIGTPCLSVSSALFPWAPGLWPVDKLPSLSPSSPCRKSRGWTRTTPTQPCWVRIAVPGAWASVSFACCCYYCYCFYFTCIPFSFFVHVQRYQGTCVEGREQPVGVASYLPLKAHFSLGHQLIDFLLIMEAQSIA